MIIQFTTEPTNDFKGGEAKEFPTDWLLNISPCTCTRGTDEITGLAVYFLEPGATASFWYFTTKVFFARNFLGQPYQLK